MEKGMDRLQPLVIIMISHKTIRKSYLWNHYIKYTICLIQLFSIAIIQQSLQDYWNRSSYENYCLTLETTFLNWKEQLSSLNLKCGLESVQSVNKTIKVVFFPQHSNSGVPSPFIFPIFKPRVGYSENCSSIVLRNTMQIYGIIRFKYEASMDFLFVFIIHEYRANLKIRFTCYKHLEKLKFYNSLWNLNRDLYEWLFLIHHRSIFYKLTRWLRIWFAVRYNWSFPH